MSEHSIGDEQARLIAEYEAAIDNAGLSDIRQCRSRWYILRVLCELQVYVKWVLGARK